MDSRAYGRWFCSICDDWTDAPLEQIKAFLLEKGFPSDALFQDAFARFDLYNSKYDRAILDDLERDIQKRKNEKVDLSECWIEHVLPQAIGNDEDGKDWISALGENWEEKYERLLHVPGNLTVVGADYNREMQNYKFSTRRPVLAKSKVYLNEFFRDEKLIVWGENQISARGNDLAKQAAKIWAHPENS